ncbi:MAG: hypothetical protein JWP25_8942 [Bradyrhizobium sp.]|nr:hypothetical protein [Bradyrhizobium sp.]
MPIVVEDGTAIQSANSYASEATLDAYADDRAITLAAGDAEAALIRGTRYIDSYRARFPGYRTNRRLQGLEWPRIIAFTRVPTGGRDYPYSFGSSDRSDSYAAFLGISNILSNEIPIEIIQATCEAAIRELADPGSMQPDMDRGGQIERLKAGSVEIQYGANASPQTTYLVIEGLLSGLLIPSSGGMVGTLARG